MLKICASIELEGLRWRRLSHRQVQRKMANRRSQAAKHMSLPDFFEPERLRAFVAVAETGSFSRAAERLRLAQPTISIQVRRLEEIVGQSLIDRKAPTAVLTETGEIFMGYVKQLLATMESARHQLTQPPLDGAVRLGVVEDFNYAAFPEILGALVERHRRFQLFVKIASTADLQSQLRKETLDIALMKRRQGSTEGELICQQKMAWVGCQTILQTEDDVVPLVLTPQNTITRDVVLRALSKAGRRWSIRFESPTLAGLQAAVQAKLGVTAFGVGMIPPDLPRSAAPLLPTLESVEFTLNLSAGNTNNVVATFADVLRRLVPMIVARLEEEQGGSEP